LTALNQGWAQNNMILSFNWKKHVHKLFFFG